MATSELPVLKSAILRSTVSLQSDNRLVELVRAGVDPAFDAIVERYRSPLLRYAGRMLDSHRAEDVVQEAFVKAHGSLMQDDRPMQLKPWLYRITHNLALDSVRQKHWNYEQLDPNYDGVRQPPDYLDQKEQLRGVIERMGVLPERQRRALILRAFEGRSSEEIAQELEDTVPEARQLVHRARVRLRNAFGALVPFPLLVWLRPGTASAAASSQSAGKLLALKGSLAKAGAALVAASAVAVGAVVVERSVTSEKPATAKVELAAGLSGPDRLPTPSSPGSQGGGAVSQAAPDGTGTPSAVGAGPATGGQEQGGSETGPSPGTESGEGASPQTPERPERGGGGGGEAPGGSKTQPPSSATPSQPQVPTAPTGGGTGGGSSGGTGGGGTGGGGTGGGGTGGGGTGGGGGDGSLCVGPVAQLPPICLPPLGGGGSGGGGGLLP